MAPRSAGKKHGHRQKGSGQKYTAPKYERLVERNPPPTPPMTKKQMDKILPPNPYSQSFGNQPARHNATRHKFDAVPYHRF